MLPSCGESEFQFLPKKKTQIELQTLALFQIVSVCLWVAETCSVWVVFLNFCSGDGLITKNWQQIHSLVSLIKLSSYLNCLVFCSSACLGLLLPLHAPLLLSHLIITQWHYQRPPLPFASHFLHQIPSSHFLDSDETFSDLGPRFSLFTEDCVSHFEEKFDTLPRMQLPFDPWPNSLTASFFFLSSASELTSPSAQVL